jgi:phenylalanyl-tRNA synthetase beta chain
MKFSEQWLREWVNPKISTSELTEQLTMAGLEVGAITPVAEDFTGVIVGEVLDIQPHPNAERLRLCTVKIAPQKTLSIICGAKNVRPHLKVAVATIGANLPNNLKIKKAKLRGIESSGMICSLSELGLAKTSTGIMELPKNAPIGKELREYLNLNDKSIEIELTPNRGDCLSIAGIAREVSVINNTKIKVPISKKTVTKIKDTFPIYITAKGACSRYVGRIIRGLNPKIQTPIWIQERLRRSDINAISPIVDITNYVMLELGQPLHAFNLAKLNTNIQVRYAKAKEAITLLNEQKLKLDEQTLVIADSKTPLAIAGVMGGQDSAADDTTCDIFLESAFFNPIEVGTYARHHGLHTDSSHRFERGVDPNLQIKAIERATELLLNIASGKAGPINEVKSEKYLPKKSPIKLRKKRIEHILGISIPDKDVKEILQHLGMQLKASKDGWLVTAPSCRFDINLEIDLLEELTRIYGYNNIPSRKLHLDLSIIPTSETKISLARIRALLVNKGYHEAITYSFVDPKLQNVLCPEDKPIELQNPISQDLSVMRTSLWPGLIQAVLYNQRRQQTRIRLFETGLCFTKRGQRIQQQPFLGGIVTGSAYPEQWGIPNRNVDFFDVKADLQYFLQAANFSKASHPALHPGRCAKISHKEKTIGLIGELHPEVKSKLGLNLPICLFELDLTYIQNTAIPKFAAISKFPTMRRDIALIVDEHISAQQLIEKILVISNKLLRNVQIFDIYQGEHIEKGKKSIALNLIFQHFSRTLVDEEIDIQVEQIIKQLKQQFKVELRR